MTDILGGISNFFKKRRAHYAEHEAYQRDCDECVRANNTGYVADWSVVGAGFAGGDDNGSTDTAASDAPSADVSDTSDFGGFGGGDSGGGGASGDF